MPENQLIYHLPATLAPREFKSWLKDDHIFETEQSKDNTRIYLDTFDWRLYRTKTVLEVILEKGHYLLTWRKLGTGEILGHRTMKVLPRFASEFIAPGLRQQMHAVIGRRSLTPQISIKSNTRKLYLLDGEKKQQLRVEMRYDRALVPNSTAYLKLPAYAYIFPYRGYQDAFDRVVRKLTDAGRLQPVHTDPLLAAMNCLDLVPEEYFSKPDFELDPDRPAYEILVQVLDTFRIIMERNIHGACKAEDPEYLHDFLIAARRTQCLLNRYDNIFPEQELKLIRQDFDWAEKFASPIRDLDIYLSLFDEFASRLDKTHRASLQPLYEYLKDQKASKQWQMRTALESTRYRKMMTDWRRFLEKPYSRGESLETASDTIREVVSRSIANLYKEILEQGRHIDVKKAVQPLIDLHQTSKKLGYHLELFQSLFSAKKIAPLLKAHLAFQENLNDFYELNLQHDALQEYREKMQKEQRTMPAWLEAIDLLVADRGRECKRTRDEFPAHFEKLSRKKMRKRVHALMTTGIAQSGGKA